MLGNEFSKQSHKNNVVINNHKGKNYRIIMKEKLYGIKN